MEDLDYPLDAVEFIETIYSNSSTTFSGNTFGHIKSINIQRCTIYGDTLSPYLFLIFLASLLRWLKRENLGYSFLIFEAKVSSVAHANDLGLLINILTSILAQIIKINKFNKWEGLELTITKCALTRCSKPKIYKCTNFQTISIEPKYKI